MPLAVSTEERDEDGLIRTRLDLALLLMEEMKARRQAIGELGMDEEIVCILLRSALDHL